MRFALYPPSDADNAVAHLWDKYMRPDWRVIAAAQEAACNNHAMNKPIARCSTS